MIPHGTLIMVCNIFHARFVVALQPPTELGHVTVVIFWQVQAGACQQSMFVCLGVFFKQETVVSITQPQCKGKATAFISCPKVVQAVFFLKLALHFCSGTLSCHVAIYCSKSFLS